MATIPINSIWDPNDTSRIITIPAPVSAPVQPQTVQAPTTGGVGWISDGNKRLDYNNGNITYSSVNAPNVRGLGFKKFPTPPQAFMGFNNYEGNPPSQASLGASQFDGYGAPDHVSRGTRDEYEESLRRNRIGNNPTVPSTVSTNYTATYAPTVDAFLRPTKSDVVIPDKSNSYNPTYTPKQNIPYNRDLGFKGYGVPEVATKGYTPPTMNGVTSKVASNNRNTPSTSTLRQPDPRWVQDVPSYTYAYQNTPAPVPASVPAVQQPNVSNEPEYGTYDYYRKYVLRG